jgi:hypothetical protein
MVRIQPEGAHGFLQGRAPGAPHLKVAAVEYGDNETVRIDVCDQDYEYVD